MYLHLEKNILIPKGKILGIFDIDTSTNNPITKGFLKLAGQEGRVFDIAEDLPRSIVVVVEDFGNISLYVSGKSGRSLKKRFDLVGEEEWNKI